MNVNRVNVIGVPISAVNMEIAVSNILDNLDAVRGEYICVSNVHTTVMAHDDPEYWRVQAESFMSIPDGKPLSVVGKKQFPEMDRYEWMDIDIAKEKIVESQLYFLNKLEEKLEKK